MKKLFFCFAVRFSGSIPVAGRVEKKIAKSNAACSDILIAGFKNMVNIGLGLLSPEIIKFNLIRSGIGTFTRFFKAKRSPQQGSKKFTLSPGKRRKYLTLSITDQESRIIHHFDSCFEPHKQNPSYRTDVYVRTENAMKT